MTEHMEQEICRLPTCRLEDMVEADGYTEQEYVWMEEELERREVKKAMDEAIYGLAMAVRQPDMPYGC